MAVTALCTLVVVAKSRSAAVLLTLLGETFEVVVRSDRFIAYRTIPPERCQICWAHLKRNLVAFAERGRDVGDWGTEAVGVVEKIFAAWYRYRDGGGSRARLHAEITPLRAQLRERGSALPSWIARALCNDVRKRELAL